MIRVYLVDDEPLVLIGLRGMLDWASLGYEVVGAARNGAEALRGIEELRPDVVVTDIVMPVMDGLTLAETCRKTDAALPVFIVLTGHEEPEYIKRSLRFGAVEYLNKRDLHASGLAAALERARRVVEKETAFRAAVSPGPVLSGLDPAAPTGHRARLVAQVQAYIRENLEKRLSLNEVAAVFNFSPNYLSRLFAHSGSGGFVEFVTAARIAHARRLMATTDLKVYEISSRVGFESPFYFSKVFKKSEGVSPREYIQKVRN